MKFCGNETISVIIIVYNVKKYLQECVNSIRNQSYNNLDIVLVDDGSTDGSGQLCDFLAKEDQKIKVVHKENGGLVSARQAGINVASGDYVAFVDGDDWVDEDMYEKMYLLAKLFSSDIVLSGIIRERPDGQKCDCNAIPNGYYDKDKLEREIYPKMMYDMDVRSPLIDPSLCNKLFKIDVIKPALLQVDKKIFYLGEDAATTYPCLLKAHGIYVTDFCMYHHRIIIQEKLSTYKREKVYERLLLFYKNLKSNFEKTIYAQIMHPQLNGYFLRLLNVITKEAIDLDILIFYQSLMDYNKESMPKASQIVYKLPFWELRNYKKIILYGAGKVGQEYYRQLNSTGICVVLWADKRYRLLSDSGLPVGNIENIKGQEYDAIILAAKKETIAESMKYDLVEAGFNKEKIVWVKPI